jgi:tetratricopeptide (TPR) repeat protein
MNPLFARSPEHPGLAHYIIHANDAPRLASLGLDAARRYAAIAPAAPHAQHMPSHIFIRLGLWEEAVAANQRSYDASAEEVQRQGRTGITAEGYHAMDYMTYAFLQLGNDTAARRVADEGLRASFVPLANAGPPLAAWYARAAMPARHALERGDWQAAAALEVLPASNVIAEGITHYARAIGAARLGDTARTRAELDAIVRVRDSLRTLGDLYWPRVMEIKRQVVESWLLLGAGDMVGAIREARAAADAEDVLAKHPVTPAEIVPARELLADMLAQLGRHDEAVAAYREVLRFEPNRRRAVMALAAMR